MTTVELVLLGFAVALPVAAAMEPWARVLHGQVWHRALWRVHRSHHSQRNGRFEANDALSAAHAPIAAALVMIGCNLHGPAAAITIGIGAGMTAFGLSYLVVHDGLVHGRLPVSFLARFAWLRRIRNAHRIHHARGEAPYGFFLGPRELKQAPRAPAEHPSAPPTSAPALAEPPDTRSSGAHPSA